MPTPNTVVLRHHGRYSEALAIGICKPGHLLALDSNEKVAVHAVPGGKTELLIAREDALQGKLTTDAYAVADVVFFIIALPGTTFLGRLPANCPAVVIGQRLCSNGDGTLVPMSGTGRQLYQNVAASAAVSNTVTETAFDKSYTLPANTLQVGDVLHIRARAKVTAQNSTDTLLLRLKMGNTTLVATAATDAAVSDVGFIDGYFTIRTIGGAGTMVGSGTQGYGVLGTATAKPFELGSTAVNTTTTIAITVSATWSVASAGNSVYLEDLNVSLERGEYNALAIAREAIDNSAVAAEAQCRMEAL